MLRSTSFVFVSLAAFVAASPAPRAAPLRELHKVEGGEATGRYIVTMKEGSEMHRVMHSMNSKVVTEWKMINGFVVEANEETLNTLLSDPDVEMVEEDGFVKTSGLVTQADAPWGLARLSSNGILIDGDTDYPTFTYDYTYDESAGEGVDIYVIDTGVYVDHNEFEGRARIGTTIVGSSEDRAGHGTHVAGIAASKKYGMAKKANIISVKVLNDDGEGTTNQVLSGIDWVVAAAIESGRPSIASMSLGGPASISMDRAVQRLTDEGVHVTVAAGNDLKDAYLYSPARAPTAITVASSDVLDYASYFTNFGPSVDIFAPGESIPSCGTSGPNSVRFLSGTSMSTPHVAGLIATLISAEGNVSVAEMTAKVKTLGQKDLIRDVPIGLTPGTVNLMAYNGHGK